jgi:hypothetical protein
MYSIVKLLDGKFFCTYHLQGGRESFYTFSLKGAVQELKLAAKVGNGVKIKKRDIKFFAERSPRTEVIDAVETTYKELRTLTKEEDSDGRDD